MDFKDFDGGFNGGFGRILKQKTQYAVIGVMGVEKLTIQ